MKLFSVTVWKVIIFLLSLLPAVYYIVGVFLNYLGGNPIEAILHGTGDWGLRFLLLSLAITPLRSTFDLGALLRFRRMIGLFSFFYICLHLSIYLVLDQFFNWSEIWKDIIDRPYITIGFAAFVLLSALAVTSNQWSIKKLGKRWKKLHKATYAIGVLAILHFMWSLKADITEPVIYAGIFAGLMLFRIKKNFFHYLKSPFKIRQILSFSND